MTTPPAPNALYRTLWRWHFYAAIFVLPFVALLSLTGAVYLFKPQIDRWEERAFHAVPSKLSISPRVQVKAALHQFPGATLQGYRLPEQAGDAVMLRLLQADGRTRREVFVAASGAVLGSLDPTQRITEIDKRLHGQLLIGDRGGWLVELVGSWAIILVISGLYLWWPRSGGLAGVLWPRLKSGPRVFWRDLHAVTGVWISGLVLVLLLTALPWTGVWGSAFTKLRSEMGWVQGQQEWTLAGREPTSKAHATHAEHDHSGHVSPGPGQQRDWARLDTIVVLARREHLAFPVIVSPPGTDDASGDLASQIWSVRSEAQNRPLQRTLTFDGESSQPISSKGFADKHIIDRAVGYGIAWHEGQLFGWVTQLLGVITALGLLTMSVSGFVMWRRRKPARLLGAPPPTEVPARMGVIAVLMFALALLLPLLAASFVVLLVFERVALPHLPGLGRWLGVVRASRQFS